MNSRLSQLLFVIILSSNFSLTLQEGGEFHPKDANGKVIYSDVDYLDTWKVRNLAKLNAFEPPHKKTGLQGLRHGKTPTGLLSYTD